MSRVAVLGDGGWGTALALTILERGHETVLWGAFPENLEAIRSTHQNRFLPGIPIPESLGVEPDLAKVVKDAEIVVLAAPSQFMRGTLVKFKPVFNPEKHLLVDVAKGIENDTLFTMSRLCREILGKSHYVALSGPSLAGEVARRVPTAVVAASEDPADALRIQREFMSGVFRIYTSGDVTGVELGGALKNVLAIAGGIVDGMGMGDNTKAALMTRGIAEMARLGAALGGRRETFSGLSGVGDLIVTCMSRSSRNHHVGEELGKGRSLAEIQKEMGMVVAEGIRTSVSTHELAKRAHVEVPLADAVYRILHHGLSPRDAVVGLMTRSAKNELE